MPKKSVPKKSVPKKRGQKKKAQKSQQEKEAEYAEQMEVYEMELAKARSLVDKALNRKRYAENMFQKFDSEEHWEVAAVKPQELFAYVIRAINEPKHLRQICGRLMGHVQVPKRDLLQLAKDYRTVARQGAESELEKCNTEFDSMMKKMVNVEENRPKRPSWATPPIVVKVQTLQDGSVVAVGTKKTGAAVGTKKTGAAVGTKKTGAAVGTKKTVTEDRHENWPADFTPKPYYIRSAKSKTGFRGVHFVTDSGNKKRTCCYRVKVGNNTICRTNDLHEACEALHAEKQKLKQEKEEKSVLDDLSYE